MTFAGVRWYKLEGIIEDEGDKRRAQQVPELISLAAEEYDELPQVHFGYGSFKTDIPFQLVSKGRSGNAIWGEASNITFYIMPPFKPHSVSNISWDSDFFSNLSPNNFCREFMTNDFITTIEHEILFTEYATYRPFHEILLMGELEFRIYLIRLLTKTGRSDKHPNNTYLYSTPYTKGYIHVLQEGDFGVRIRCTVESASKKIGAGFTFILADMRKCNVMGVISPILATLSFDEEVDVCKSVIASKILESGIHPATNSIRKGSLLLPTESHP
jgi:hypothetical protein